MTPKTLQAWRERHRHSLKTGAEALGVSRATFAAWLAKERPIPPTVAMLCSAIDRIHELEGGT